VFRVLRENGIVKGGEKPDRRGGVKIDHFGRREGLICLDLQG
jgi:hypothetical protein